MKVNHIFLILVVMGILVACSSPSGAEPIAVQPKDVPIAVYPQDYETTVIYNATLDLEVANVDRAAERAKEVITEQNGYLVGTQSWYQDGEKYMMLVLVVPVMYFDISYDNLSRLGSRTGEWISSDLVNQHADPWEKYSQITLYLYPKPGVFSNVSVPNWRPIRTFEKAWGVFISIFGFLLDILIWVVVVLGPFVLIGWGIYRLIHRVQKKV